MAGVDASAMWELVSSLQGLNGNGSSGSTEQATCTRVDNDGTVWVRLLGAEIDTPVNGQRLADVVVGDNVTVTIEDGLLSVIGNSSRPSTSASHVEEVVGPVVQRVTEVVNVVADKASVGELQAATARIGELEADHVAVDDLTAVTGRIQSLESDHVSVADFQAEQANIDTLQASTADIDTIRANSAKVQNLTAAQLEADHATVGSLSTTYATIANLNAANGRITNLESTKANISDLEANYITADEIEATYMHANMSNSDVAWIENGTIKNGAIVSAMINDVSANKLTAGTINGSVINVTNLNADNITTGTINGQRIGEGSLSLSKLDESVYTEAEVNNIVDGLNDRIDGAIETFTGTAVPTLNNSPASSWNTTKLKDEHVGDVYYVVNPQSQQNGYCYRFTKSGNTYSWQLIKDSDVTAALQRISAAEGKITTFDSDISTLKTDTGTLTTRTTNLETRADDVDATLLDKVDVTTFNEVSDTVDAHTQTISQHTTAISNKADSSTVTTVTNRVSKTEQDISGINTTIGELQETVETKADGSTVSTISNKLNTVSDTVDGHTQAISSVQNTLSTKADSSTVSTLTTKVNTVSDTVDGHTQRLSSVEDTLETKADGSTVSTISTKVNNISDTVDGHTSQLQSVTSTQTSMQSTLDKTVKSSIQLWYSKANTTAPSKPTSQVTSTSTNGGAWRTVVPSYNASYPNYYYCWQYEYVDGTYGWSAVVRDIAMGESQATARTADSNASAAVTTANTASTNASTALTTANTASTNASEAKTAATTASTTASEAKTTAETAASDASTAKSNAASAVSTANSASTTATNAQSTANANIKSSVQLWFTKANGTAPNKPTSVVSTSNANTANAWNLVVPVWNSSYPHYFYCYQQQKGDGTYQWTDVVYDRATSEAQQLANTTSTNLSTLQTNYATFKQTTEQFESTVGSRLTTIESDIDGVEERVSDNETSISNNASAIALKANSSDVYTKTAVDGKITQEVTDRNAAITAKANEITSTVSENYTTKQESQQAIAYVANAENNYGFQYHKDIVVYGDTDKYYPVYFTNLTSQTVTHEVMIMRGYAEQAPDDWKTSTHKGSLNLRFRWNFGGWGGATYNAEITSFSEMYATILGDVLVGADAGMFSIVFLRGGGTVGALYHVYSEVPFSQNAYMQNAGVVGENDVPYVGLTEGTVYANAGETYKWTVRAPLTAPNTTHINQLYTVQRVVEAESSIVQTADRITSTVSKISGVKYLESVSAGWPLRDIKTYAAEGVVATWIVVNSDNVRVGDAILIKGYDTTRQCNVYVKGTVNSIYGNSINITAHGYEDVLPSDVVISSINQSAESVKIQASRVEIDGTAVFNAIKSSTDAAYDAKGSAATAKSEAISAAANDATTKVNAVQVGGRNLLKYSRDYSQGYIGSVGTDNSIDGTYQQCSVWKHTKSQTNSYEEALTTTASIVSLWTVGPDEDYVLSFWAKASANLSITSYFYYGGNNTCDLAETSTGYKSLSSTDGGAITNIGTEWARYWVHWHFNSNTDPTKRKNLVVARMQADATGTVWIAGPKLEKGNKATDWSPAAEDSLAEEQYIYISSASGTTSINKNTTWVTQSSDVQNVWTTKRPTYNSSYPVLFVAKQSKTVGGSVSCTTPVKDDTTTVVDGAHITTGTIDTNRLNADTIKSNIVQTTDLSASKITSGTLSTDRLDAAAIKSNIVQTTDLSASKITSGDISADRIKANVIGAINSLTAGQINAARINASQLTIGQSQVTNLTSALNSKANSSNVYTKSETDAAITAIEIGGRNLLIGSSTGAGWSYSTFDKSSVTYTRSTTATSESFVQPPLLTFDAGETYTLSCWAKSNGNVTNMDMYKVHSSGGGSHQYRINIPLTTEYQKITWTFVCNATSEEIAWIRFDNNGSKTSGTEAILYIKEPKLEKGNKATDWTPAPEDVDADISEAAKTASNYITTIDTNNGIKIANASPSSATTYLQLASNFLDFIRGGVSMLKAWIDETTATAKVRVGAEQIDGTDTFNTLTDNEGIKLRRGTTILSQFATNLIELGKNGYDATISLLNNGIEIYATDIDTDHRIHFGKITSGDSYLQFAPWSTVEGDESAYDAPAKFGVKHEFTSTRGFGIDDSVNIGGDGFVGLVTALVDSDDVPLAEAGMYASVDVSAANIGSESSELGFYGGKVLLYDGGGNTSTYYGTFSMSDVANAIPVTLYDNASAAASAAATLSETAANFRRITIFYKDTDGVYGSVEVWNPNGKRVCLSLTWIKGSATQTMYQRVRWVFISGTSISTNKASADTLYRTGQAQISAAGTVTNNDYISIVHVIGYR